MGANHSDGARFCNNLFNVPFHQQNITFSIFYFPYRRSFPHLMRRVWCTSVQHSITTERLLRKVMGLASHNPLNIIYQSRFKGIMSQVFFSSNFSFVLYLVFVWVYGHFRQMLQIHNTGGKVCNVCYTDTLGHWDVIVHGLSASVAWLYCRANGAVTSLSPNGGRFNAYRTMCSLFSGARPNSEEVIKQA